MLAILESIDSTTTGIEPLVALVETLRPRRPGDILRATANVRTLTQLLKGNPAHALSLRNYLFRLLAGRRHASLYSEVGVLSNDGFFTELKRRIAYRILPPAFGDEYLADALDQILYRQTDHLWIAGVPARFMGVGNSRFLGDAHRVVEAHAMPAPERLHQRGG